MEKLKYLGYSIVFQEVPDEVSLTLNISNCPYRCKSCHSKFLWENEGVPVTESLPSLLEEYKGKITAVCFMGGDQNMEELTHLLELVHLSGYKTCLYAGSDNLKKFDELLPLLDYLKIGHYEEELGGLDSETTNQRFYCIKHEPLELIDQTIKFRRHYE